MRLVVVLVGLAIGFPVSTVTQQKDTVDPNIEQQIRALASKYDEAFNRNDAPAVTALYTEDGVHAFNGTSHGRQAIEKSYAQYFKSWHPHSRFTTVSRISAVGNEGTFERKMERNL
jgi:ketosteroid isomerase-like protein